MNTTELLFYTVLMTKFDLSAHLYGAEMVTKSTLETAGIIQKLIIGPLRGKDVTLVTENDSSSGRFIATNLTASIKEPIIHWHLSKKSLINDKEINEVQKPRKNGSKEQYVEIIGEFTTKSVLIIVITGDAEWRPFHDIGKKMAKSIILILLSTSCQKQVFFETPLLYRTSFVTLYCLSKRRKGSKIKTSFRMWSWRPYTRGKQTVDLGVWNPEALRSFHHIFIDRFDDMSKKYMSIEGNTEEWPNFYNESDGTLTGVNLKILQECGFYLRFNLNITASSVFTWHGMLQKLKRGETDLFLNGAVMTTEKHEDFDLLRPYYQEGYGLMLRNPPPLSRWKNILYPFSWTVWIAVVISMMSTSVMYHIIYHDQEKSFPNNALSVLQCMLSNAMQYIPKQWRVRIFLLVWWIASWLLHASYTCNLIAVLTVPASPTKIQTAKELAESSIRLCMVDYGDFVPEALRTSTQPVLASLGRVLDMVPLNLSLDYIGGEECIKRVMKGTHSHLSGSTYLKILYGKLGHSSTAYHIREQLYPGYLVFLTTKNSPWSYKISNLVERMIEAGLVEKWYTDTLVGLTGDGSNIRRQQLQALTMDHLQGPFYLQVGGMCISALALVWEFFSASKVWCSASM